MIRVLIINFINQLKMVKIVTRKDRNHKVFAKSRPFASLQQCIQQLTMEQSPLTAKKAIAQVHKLCKSKTKLIMKIRKQATEILKICRLCDKWNKAKNIITCENCDDHYHYKCYQASKKAPVNSPFICHLCLQVEKLVNKCQFCSKHFRRTEKVDICKSCQYQYHTDCFNKELSVCNRCAKVAQKITSFSINQRNQQKLQPKINQMFEAITRKNFSKTKQSNHLFQSKGLKFVCMKLLSKGSSVVQYKRKLMEVIQLKKMNYTEYLIDFEGYLETLSPESMDFGLTNMSKAEQKEYIEYKNQPIGPFRFENTPEKGVDVIADMDIPQYSIICQYIGEVLTLRKCINLEKFQKNDSVMDLWIGKNSQTSLVICPNKWTNIARFVNGVGKRKEQKNVNSIKICFRGKPMILLVSSRKIKKGQSLCYDYNGDNQSKYPTDSFV